ncbi:hypothetical protein QFC21_000084 [Naganishia friedmannii]|uniref:Uncharacterized protein n=1 Tax=Naganishia friedmannii TaxID=89922 RepID=A0ACC2WC45_9TREE|nr:hypothetical protein QFC21_000084 [Naganishia friedmannii]
MHLTTALSLALLSISLAPWSSNGGSSLVPGVAAQPESQNEAIYVHNGSRKRKRSSLGRSPLSVIMGREEEKRQFGVIEDALGDLVDSADDEFSSVVAKVTGGKVAAVSPAAVASVSDTLSSTSTTVIASAIPASKTAIVPVSSSTSSTSDAVVTSAVKNLTPIVSVATSDIRDSLPAIDSLITSSQVLSSTTVSTHTTSLATSLTSSAKTDAEGSVIYVTSVETVRASFSSSTTSIVDDTTSLKTMFAIASATGNSSAAGASQPATLGDSKVLSTGVIIAISVAGGVVVLAIVLFFIWKLKQKRFSGYDDDADGIKWPELNRHGESSTMPLPAKPTGGYGLETSAERRMGLDDDGFDEYDPYSAPVSYGNPANDHYAGYGEDLPPVPPLPPMYQMNNSTNLASGHYPGHGEQLPHVPSLPPIYQMNNSHDPYDTSTIAAGEGVTLGQSQSNGGVPIADVHHAPLGGTGAFEVDAPEMMAMTGAHPAQYPRGDDNHNTSMGMSGSGRFL